MKSSNGIKGKPTLANQKKKQGSETNTNDGIGFFQIDVKHDTCVLFSVPKGAKPLAKTLMQSIKELLDEKRVVPTSPFSLVVRLVHSTDGNWPIPDEDVTSEILLHALPLIQSRCDASDQFPIGECNLKFELMFDKKYDINLFNMVEELFDKFSALSEVSPLISELTTFRDNAAVILGPLLLKFLQDNPHETYEEKKSIARFVTIILDNFGLAIVCPETGKKSMLQGLPQPDPAFGRFQIYHRENGQVVVTRTSTTLERLLRNRNSKLPVDDTTELRLIALPLGSSSHATQDEWVKRIPKANGQNPRS
jgi:hypothetical protein